MSFINEVNNINSTSENKGTNNAKSTSQLNFLDYVTTPRDTVSYQDVDIQEKLLEVLEELNEQNEENLFDNLVNNMVDYYTNQENTNSIKQETIDKLADVVEQLEQSLWFKL